ncbi:MAG: pseudouridine synthase [Roseateles depolymerans]|uniref:Pseudouridine synthase n=1 Tax=Roseateles depolymerans TaxID=76731 RepID=A0A2W5DI20_9BURK|nr:MAG: pseudouridine synthase [Roseateles depolymerans]
MKKRLTFWLLQVLIALDQLINAMLFFGWADETISARSWRQREKWQWRIARRVIDRLFALLGDSNHCQSAFESEVQRRQLPDALR